MVLASLTSDSQETISDVFKKIQQNKHGCIFVTDSNNKVIGVATDGDIRRYLIENDNLKSPIKECMNASFVWASQDATREYILKLLDHRVSIIPILDQEGILIDFVSRKQFPIEKQANVTVRSRSPVRISFGGGGTDLTHYFVNNDKGAVLNSTVKIYTHCSMKKTNRSFSTIDSIDLGEKIEFESIDSLSKNSKFSLIASLLELINPNYSFDLTIRSDFPVGSGLGGSAVVLSAIIGCFNQFREDPWDRHEIAELAFQAERIFLNMAGGWQDQYATVFGGFNFMEFQEKENIIHPLKINKKTMLELEESLLLCNTNLGHISGAIHEKQRSTFNQNKDVQALVHENRELTYNMKSLLLRGSLKEFGKTLDKAWKLKRQFSEGITSSELDKIYDRAIESGADGGKLLGAGGGGYFIFYVDPELRNKVESSLIDMGLKPQPVYFDGDGLQTWKIRQN